MGDNFNKLVSNIHLTEKTLDHLEFTFEDYLNYLKTIDELDELKKNLFLKALKNREIVNNQETEMEESFMVELYNISRRKDSVDIVMKIIEDGLITKEELRKLHRVVIKGSNDDIPENYNYRMDNDKWVGSFDTYGGRVIDYMPPDYNKIDNLINQTLKYLNNNIGIKNLDHTFIKPFIVHALIAYIQPFGNGNTRLARVLQHGKIWQMTNHETEFNMSMPTIYLSKNYLQTRPQYRELIKDIAVNYNDESWNRWLNYNLNMIDEQLYFHEENLKRLKRM